MGAYDAAIDPQADDIARLHDLIRQALPELPASRKHGISLYVLALTEDGRYLAESRAAEFPKASVGKSCIRFKRLDDLDLGALRSLLEEAGRLPAPGAV